MVVFSVSLQFIHKQGDQISFFENIAQNVAQPIFSTILTFSLEIMRSNIGASAIIFKKLPKENIHPMGENSPNLVALHHKLPRRLDGISSALVLIVRKIPFIASAPANQYLSLVILKGLPGANGLLQVGEYALTHEPGMWRESDV
jgi:hypothetical protein